MGAVSCFARQSGRPEYVVALGTGAWPRRVFTDSTGLRTNPRGNLAFLGALRRCEALPGRRPTVFCDLQCIPERRLGYPAEMVNTL